MSTVDYAKKAATANRMIAKYGSGRTLQRKITDRTNPARPVVTTENVPCIGIEFDATTDQVNGETVLVGDKLAYVAPSLLVAAIANRDFYIDKEGVSYTITKVEKLAPDGVVVLWTFWLRK